MSTLDFSSLIGRNHQAARIAYIKPRPALKLKKKRGSSASKSSRLAAGRDLGGENGDVVYYVVKNEDEDEDEDENGNIVTDENETETVEEEDKSSSDDDYNDDEVKTQTSDEHEPPWKAWLRSDIAEAEAAADNYRKAQIAEEQRAVLQHLEMELECEEYARGLIRKTNYIRSHNLDEKEHDQRSEERTETFNSWLTNEVLMQMHQEKWKRDLSLPPAFHEIEQADWESKINWEGAASETEEVGEQQQNREKKNSRIDPNAYLNRVYNPILDAMDFSAAVNWDGADAPPGFNEALARSVPLILEESVAGSSVARLTVPPRRPVPLSRSEVYLRRCQREAGGSSGGTTSFSAFSNEDTDEIIAQRQEKRARMAIDKSKRVTEAMGTLDLGDGKGRAITSSLMGPGGTERTGRPTKGIDSSSMYDAEHVEQLDLVLNHHLVKPDLKKSELRQFHRPRLPMNLVKKDRIWQLKVRVDASKKAKSQRSADGSTIIGPHSLIGTHPGAISQAKIKTESDLTAAEGNLVIFEYCEERPPLQMAKGTACKIVNYYRGDKSRCPISAGGGDRPPQIKRAGDTSIVTSGKVEKPRFDAPTEYDASQVTDLIGMKKPQKQSDKSVTADDGGEASKKKKKDTTVDVLPEGVSEILLPKVHGPFIGEVEEGQTQSGLISNLFVAPIFRHEPEPSDFLMILGKKPSKHQFGGGNSLSVILRPFPSSVYCCGQTEPRVKAWAPNTTGEKNFTAPFQTYQIAKYLTWTETKEGHGLRFDEISDRLFANTRILQNALRQRIKQVAVYDKITQIWATKKIGFEDYPGAEALGRRFSPESVAAYESASSYVQRLTDLGIHELYNGSNSVQIVGQAMIYLNGAVNAARERKSKMAKLAENAKTLEKQGNKASQAALYEQAASKMEALWKDGKRKQEVARFIYEELALAPWHLTQEFIDIHKNAQGTAMMRLTGIGDPSGRGEGYNFMREIDTKPNKMTGNTDGALNAQIKKITGTENDLRKLTMKEMASLLRSYGMRQKDIDTLKRWDRVHCIRDLSTKAASDGMGDGFEKFARGEKMKLSDQKQMYHDRVQEIWRRQRTSLSTDAGTFDADKNASAVAASEKSAAAENAKQEQEEEADESDSDSDDDYEAMLEEAMLDGREANRLVADQLRGDSVGPVGRLPGDGELRDDARELAAFRRQQEEERATKEGLLSTTSGAERKKPSTTNRKCIRRKITKTMPDGTQTIQFEFVVLPEEVAKIARQKQDEQSGKVVGDGKKKDKSKPSQKARSDSYTGEGIVGHALFEEDDDDVRRIKLKVERVETKRSKGGRGLPKSPPKLKLQKRPKLLIGTFKEKDKAEKKKKKRLREAEEAELYSAAPHRKGTSNRRERGSIRERMPHVIMADRLETIRAQVEARPLCGPFKRAVNRRLIPHYYEIISDPIDLQTIRDKNGRYEYKSADIFLKDFELMKNNAIKFNGVGSAIGIEATAIYEFVKKTIESNREELTKMEEAVRDQMSSGRKRIKTGNGGASPSSQVSTEAVSRDGPPSLPHSMSMANVMLDGIETTVNLGNLEMHAFNFDDVSDSDDSMAMALKASEV